MLPIMKDFLIELKLKWTSDDQGEYEGLTCANDGCGQPGSQRGPGTHGIVDS